MIINDKAPPIEPQAQQRPLVRNLYDTKLTDEFAWLKTPNWREVMRDPHQLEPAIRAYLQAENDYCDHAFADNAALQEALFAEMKGRIKEDDSSVPDPDGPYAYYVRYRKDGQHSLLCRQPRNGGAEQLLLDGDALARGKPFFQLGATSHSPDHRLLAWTSDEPGSEFYTARVRVIESNEDLADSVTDVSGSVVWTQDSPPFTTYASTGAIGLQAFSGIGSERRPAPMYSCLRRPIRAFSFQSVAIHRAVSVTLRRTITRPRKFGSLTSATRRTSRHWLLRGKPASNTKSNIILISMAGRP